MSYWRSAASCNAGHELVTANVEWYYRAASVSRFKKRQIKLRIFAENRKLFHIVLNKLAAGAKCGEKPQSAQIILLFSENRAEKTWFTSIVASNASTSTFVPAAKSNAVVSEVLEFETAQELIFPCDTIALVYILVNSA